MNKKYFWGINILGTMLLLSSFLWMFLPYLDFQKYRTIFSHLTYNAALLRYVLSIFGRTVGFIAGAGILWRNNICRKIGIILCTVTICTIYIKHPYILFAG